MEIRRRELLGSRPSALLRPAHRLAQSARSTARRHLERIFVRRSMSGHSGRLQTARPLIRRR